MSSLTTETSRIAAQLKPSVQYEVVVIVGQSKQRCARCIESDSLTVQFANYHIKTDTGYYYICQAHIEQELLVRVTGPAGFDAHLALVRSIVALLTPPAKQQLKEPLQSLINSLQITQNDL